MINNYSLRYIAPRKLIFHNSKLKLKRNDVLIEIKSCGICGSDLKIFNGYNKRVKKKRVIGHEIAGKIINSPKNQKLFQVNSNILLGADIENDLNKDLALGHEIDGGFQKYLKININLLKKTPHYITKKKIDYNLASLAEPLACCLNGIEQISFKPKKNVLIFGAGPIGQLLAKLSLFYGANKVFLTDINKYKLNNGIKDKKITKITFTKLKNKISLNSDIANIKFIFVACSSLLAQKQAIEFANNDTSINFFAGLKKQNKMDPILPINTNHIHYKQLKIVGSHGSKFRHLRKAGELIIKKKIKINNIISHIFNLKDFKKAFRKLASGNSLKIIIQP